MTDIRELEKRYNQLERKTSFTEDEAIEYVEVLSALIEQTHNYVYAEDLGGYYYGLKDYDLALKYYELAVSYGSHWANNGLGYIWYYGRTGQVDYEKAFNCFSYVLNDPQADINWQIEAAFKIADMYRNGYYVEKDYDQYVAIIEDLYKQVSDNDLFSKPEVYSRLASIRKKQGRNEEALELLYDTRYYLSQRLSRNNFFGDLNRMKWAVNDIYALEEFDPTEFDLYDLYYLLKEPHVVSFLYDGERHEVEARQDEEINIRFDDKWYRNIDAFFQNASIDGQSIEALKWFLDDWRIEE